MAVRFNNLVSLLRDMKRKGWVVDSFPFSYNGVNTIVVLTLYKDGEKKPTPHKVAKVCFVLRSDARVDLSGTVDFWNVSFNSKEAFCDFWHIQNRNLGRHLFDDFSCYFATFIPREKVVFKQDAVERRVLGGRTEGNALSAIYCYDVRRNGKRVSIQPLFWRCEI